MGSRQFRWYDTWRAAPLSCENCGWSGPLDSRGIEAFSDLVHFECPDCQTILAIISFPTQSETEEAARRGNPEAASELDRLRRVNNAADGHRGET